MPNLEVGRLALLGGGILVVVLLLALVARSCSGNGTSSANEKYLSQVKSALHLSDQAGAKLATLTRAARPMQASAAAAQATAAADLEKQAVQEANAIKPTKQAQAAHGALIQALSYRQQGLTCLAAALPPAYKAKAGPAAASVTPCMQQLLASDVVYLSSYQGVLNNALSDAHVAARAPSSVILPQSSVPTVTTAGATQMLQRLKPGTATHGLHGMSLDTVIAQSGGQNVTLRPGGEVNQVKANSDLALVVTATNGGDFEELDVKVTATLQAPGKSKVTKSATIDQVASKQKATVTITGLGADASNFNFSSDVKLTVLVEPVPGERTTSNNKGVYTIAFTVGQ